MLSLKTTARSVLSLSAVIFMAAALSLYAQDKPAENKVKKEIKKEKVVKAGREDAAKGCACCTGHEAKAEKTSAAKAEKPWNAVCPVLGNKVDASGPTVTYNGKVYAFCCPGCDTKFQADPEKYSKNISKDGKKFLN